MKLAIAMILAAAPHADAALCNAIVRDWHYAEDAGIVTPRQTAVFLGHCAVESAGFTRLEESLFYTTAARVRAVWPSRFKSDDTAAAMLRNPEKLANAVYGGRLGNTEPGDGWLYRGSGLLQTTGKDNFAAVQKATGVKCLDNPELLRSMPEALQAAAVFWKVNKLNELLDRPDFIEATTKRIQGGTGGLQDRTIYISRFLTTLGTPGRGVLRRVASNNPQDVMWVQTALQKRGYYGGKIDGRFGPGTEQAVRDFQDDAGLSPVDGVVGTQTYEALNA